LWLLLVFALAAHLSVVFLWHKDGFESQEILFGQRKAESGRASVTRIKTNKQTNMSFARLRLFSQSFSTTSSQTRSPSLLRTALYTAVVAAPAGLLAVYYFDARSALHEHLLAPILRNALDPETAHKFSLKVLKSGLAPKDPLPDDHRLAVQVCRLSRHEM